MLTRVFKNGNSLAVRLPAEFALPEGEVEIVRHGNELIIRPVEKNLLGAWEALCSFSDDFMSEGREQPPLQERETVFD
ncbi:antitoxin [Nitrosococcus wardiae]|uniref:Antitoxin n=2 Tax=Nitrosococcus wardiae TaxID=1814290 RepID=A0A4P7C6F1_9GAMM|nr:antitoxin [Nitrosococcus wardiae]